jgi:hypothetical protein
MSSEIATIKEADKIRVKRYPLPPTLAVLNKNSFR